MVLSWIFLAVQLSFAVLVFFLTIAFITGAPYVPSTDPVAAAMIRLAGLKPGMTAYDLGSGDGKLLRLAATAGAWAIGLEINPLLVLGTRMRFLFSPYGRLIRVRWADFWRADLSQSDAVFIYLLPWRMKKLREKLLRELKPGSVVVSNSFIFPDWKIWKKDDQLHVYAYRVPKKSTN